jgi:hypothetical protein
VRIQIRTKISQISADPDPHQNVTDHQHWIEMIYFEKCRVAIKLFSSQYYTAHFTFYIKTIITQEYYVADDCQRSKFRSVADLLNFAAASVART